MKKRHIIGVGYPLFELDSMVRLYKTQDDIMDMNEKKGLVDLKLDPIEPDTKYRLILEEI